jgi:hypothetical protein
MGGDARLIDLVPSIRRARGFRLYDGAGGRYLDLYQDGGAAILGHRSPGSVREMKEALSRGLVGGLPSHHEKRLQKALLRLFPGYRCVRTYSSPEKALEAVSAFLGVRVDEGDVFDPAFGSLPASRRVSFWRPFLPAVGPVEPEVLIPILPLTGRGSFTAACFRSAEGKSVPASDPVPPYLLAGSLRGLADLAVARRSDDAARGALEGAYGWKLNGPYIAPAFPASAYPAVFRAFLDAGVLLSPFFPGPSILPAEASPGEICLLEKLFHAQLDQ